MINFFAYSSLATALASLFIGLFVVSRNIKSKLNLLWFATSLNVAFWSFGLYREVLSNSENQALFWNKILYIGAIFVPIFLFHFIVVLVDLEKKNKLLLRVGYSFFTLMLFLNFFTKLFVKGVPPKAGFNYWVEPGLLYYLYFLMFASYIIYGIRLMFVKYKISSGIKKQQIKYVIIAVSVGSLGGATNFFPQLIGTYPFGNFFTIFYVVGISYAIIKYRLLDIRFVISRSILYFALIGFVATIFTSITFLTAEVFNATSTSSRLLITLVVSIIIVVGLDPLKRFLSNITDKVFYRGKIDYQNVLRKLSEITAKEINLEKLLIDLTQNIEKLLKYKKVDFLYKSNSSGIYRGIINNTEIITDQEEIVKYLKDSKEIIITEELEVKMREKFGEEKKYLLSIIKRLQKMKVGLIAPIISEDRIVAFFIVNKKMSDDVFSSEDLSLISVINPQIANALEKSKLYNEVQEFNVKLQEKVDKATEELKHANADLETRNKYLTALQKVSSTISRSLDFTEVVQFIANSIQTEIGFEGGIVNFIDEKDKSIYIGAITKDKKIDQATKDLTKNLFDYKVSLAEKDNLAVKSILNGEIQKSSKIYDLFKPAINQKMGEVIQQALNIHSAIAVPIHSGNKIIGSIDFFIKKQIDEIKDIDIEVMKSLADQAGLVIDNLKLYKQIKEKNVALKHANVHLKKLDEAKSEFLSIASHQLRTPLTGIKGYLSMILEGDYGKVPGKQEKIIQDVFNASDRMSRLINVFLNVSRIESGRLKLDYTDVNLRVLIEECIKDLKSSAQEKGLKLSFDYKKGKVPIIKADSDKIKDVALNLIDNAIKYTPKGKIDIKLLKQDNDVLVQIKDTGIGLNKEGIEKLFNKFSRGEGISKINTSGSGLGLYIVRRIIEEHNGKVWVESEGLDKGSTFQFTLPIKK